MKHSASAALRKAAIASAAYETSANRFPNSRATESLYLESRTKRAFDILGASAAVVLLSPIFVMVAILVRSTSRGPVFYRQQRIGRGSRPFVILKFRTMRHEPDAGSLVRQTALGDARVTRVGRLLRRTSLDELPQLVNVIKGEMSLVGPRPHAVPHDEEFSRQVPNYVVRHAAKPGISGLAQVNGARGAIGCVEDVQRRVTYDLAYISHASLAADLRIVARTLAEVVASRDAY